MHPILNKIKLDLSTDYEWKEQKRKRIHKFKELLSQFEDNDPHVDYIDFLKNAALENITKYEKNLEEI